MSQEQEIRSAKRVRRPIRVLVVDDSAFMRRLLVKMLEPFEDIEVVATAMDGMFALEKLERAEPDVVTLDLEMPRMDGFSTLTRLVEEFHLPVILVSAHTSAGASATFEGLAAGAVDFVTKPQRIFSSPLESLAADLVGKIRTAARSKPANVVSQRKSSSSKSRSPFSGAAHEVVAIAVSTGGPNALSQLVSQLDPGIRFGILIVQHMPAGFTRQFADRLSRLATIDVREAEDGALVRSGEALVAPGGQHMEVLRNGGRLIVHLTRSEPVRGHRPSADVLFHSVARHVGAKSIGMILTGMGEDGAAGMESIRAAGGLTLAQNEASSVVFGMPKAAIGRGAVEKVLSLGDMAPYLNSLSLQQGGTSWIA